jgi:fructuronate reductase
VVHLGLGAFFRAHGALFTEDVLADQDGDWGIIGASFKRPDQRDRLTPQDCLYTTVENGRNGRKARIVGCLLNVLVGPENPAALLDRLSYRETAIVTLTVTEKGYHHDPAPVPPVPTRWPKCERWRPSKRCSAKTCQPMRPS